MTEAIFVVLVIVGATSTILALAALLADFMFPERQHPQPPQRSQATYKKDRP
jgi:hypothetical protein